MRRRDLVPVAHHGVGQIQLTIQLQRARLHRQRPRGGAGRGGLVDDTHAHAQFAQPQSQHQTGRAGADDQNVAAVHEPVLRWLCSKYGSDGKASQCRPLREQARSHSRTHSNVGASLLAKRPFQAPKNQKGPTALKLRGLFQFGSVLEIDRPDNFATRGSPWVR